MSKQCSIYRVGSYGELHCLLVCLYNRRSDIELHRVLYTEQQFVICDAATDEP